jgi:CRISPR-associated protein Cst1
MLQYTGHPFVDIGIAAITSFVQKRHPEEVTVEDLEIVAQYIEHNYIHPPLRGYLTMAFTSNAWFAQDAFNPNKPTLSTEERVQRTATRNEWANRHVRQWQPGVTGETGDEICVFTGQATTTAALSGKLPSGRAGRAQVPLLQGDEAINFFTNGQPGLPISGAALLALQLFPLGCARCGIGLLAIHSDNEHLTYRLTREILLQNLADIVQAQTAHEEKLPKSPRSLKTLLVEMLVKIEQQRSYAEEDQEPASITAYNFNNGKDLGLTLYHLPLEIVQFLQIVETPTYKASWNRIVQRGWQLAQNSKKKPKQLYIKRKQHDEQKQVSTRAPQKGDERRYNTLYEDIFDLSHLAGIRRFIRTYFLRIPNRGQKVPQNDPRRLYSLQRELDLVDWTLLELFLQKVVRMDSTRIAHIRTLGDGLAIYVRRQGARGKRFFRSFFTEQNPSNFRTLLLKANIAHMKDGQASLFDMDTYIEVFEEGFEVMRPDWRLARDLVLMRMIDQLKDWLAQNPDATPTENGDDEQGDQEERTPATTKQEG